MPKTRTPRKSKPFYKAKPPKPPGRAGTPLPAESSHAKSGAHGVTRPTTEKPAVPEAGAPIASLAPGTPLSPAHFELRDDGEILPFGVPPSGGSSSVGKNPDRLKAGLRTRSAVPEAGAPDLTLDTSHLTPSPTPSLIFKSESPFLRLYHGNCLELLDAMAAKYPDGRFDCIFADPPYFLSNGGITCHAGKMVKVDKGDWDKSQGIEENHNFNREWLSRCQRVLKPNGTICVSGTHHVIFSIGFAMQQLGMKILNDIAWEKPNPPPNLSCRYFTHSTETILWAAKNEKSKHVFNYAAIKAVTGKQMKTVWRKEEFQPRMDRYVVCQWKVFENFFF